MAYIKSLFTIRMRNIGSISLPVINTICLNYIGAMKINNLPQSVNFISFKNLRVTNKRANIKCILNVRAYIN